MDSLERRLIELNETLIKLYTAGKDNLSSNELDILQKSQFSASSLTGDNNINISDDDTIIVNDCKCCCKENECDNGDDDDDDEEPDPPEPVECECCISNTVLVENTSKSKKELIYNVAPETSYIGVSNLFSKTRVILPPESPELSKCPIKIIKLEMGPPIGNRRVTIESSDGAMIDNENEYTLQVPYEAITLIRRGDDWHIIGHYND